jgi:transcriptional regulator with XRE-family HTH domain
LSIRDKRLAAKMTQLEVAKKLLVDQSTVSNWELGRNPPLPKYQKQLAKMFRCTIEDIMEGYPDAKS